MNLQGDSRGLARSGKFLGVIGVLSGASSSLRDVLRCLKGT